MEYKHRSEDFVYSMDKLINRCYNKSQSLVIKYLNHIDDYTVDFYSFRLDLNNLV